MRMVDSSGNNTATQGTANTPGFTPTSQSGTTPAAGTISVDALDSWKDYVVERDSVSPAAPTLQVLSDDNNMRINLKVTGEGGSIINISGSSNLTFVMPDSGEIILNVVSFSNYSYLTTYNWNVNLSDKAKNTGATATATYTTPAPPKRVSACTATTAGKVSYPFSGSYDISSRFGYRDLNGDGDTNDEGELHDGVDFEMDIGTEIIAAHSGKITFVGTDQYGGKYMDLTDSVTGIKTRYLHLSRFLVPTNATITQGQLIAYSGNTGFSTGPHLHFGFFLNGVALDPLAFLADCTPVAPPPSTNPGDSGADDEDYIDIRELEFKGQFKDDFVEAESVVGDLIGKFNEDIAYYLNPLQICLQRQVTNACSSSELGSSTQRFIEYNQYYFNGLAEGIGMSAKEFIEQLLSLIKDIFTNPQAVLNSLNEMINGIISIVTNPSLILKIINESTEDILGRMINATSMERTKELGKLIGGVVFNIAASLIGGGVAKSVGKIAARVTQVLTGVAKEIKLLSRAGKTIKLGQSKVSATVRNIAGKVGFYGDDIENVVKQLDVEDYKKLKSSLTNLDEVETPLDDFTSCVLKKSIAFAPQSGSVSIANNNLLATILTGSVSAEAAVSSGGCSQVQTNRTNGNLTRDNLQTSKYPGARKEVRYETSNGTRYVDIDVGDKIVESKFGRLSKTKSVLNQIAKDVEILAKNSNKSKAIWEFTRSTVTGKTGPTESLFNELIKNNIEVFVDGKKIVNYTEIIQ
jgi:murein DD-endopeptidase MepM/ murein hydrolase activator NlpD